MEGPLSELAICANPKKMKTTLINIEEIDNGYIVGPARNYIGRSEKVYIQELSQLLPVLAQMFGMSDDPAQNS